MRLYIFCHMPKMFRYSFSNLPQCHTSVLYGLHFPLKDAWRGSYIWNKTDNIEEFYYLIKNWQKSFRISFIKNTISTKHSIFSYSSCCWVQSKHISLFSFLFSDNWLQCIRLSQKFLSFFGQKITHANLRNQWNFRDSAGEFLFYSIEQMFNLSSSLLIISKIFLIWFQNN